MRQKMIDKKKYTKKCSNCFYGRTFKDNSEVICEKKGLVETDSCCRHYKYDPLKRVPERLILPEYSKEDFEI